jgi:DNA-binding response OmpR family regulator
MTTTAADFNDLKTPPSILLVEDDPNLGSVLQDFLEMKGCTVQRCEDGLAGLQAAMKSSEKSNGAEHTLFIFDIMLPKKDGFTLAREVRQFNTHTPIIFLTARGRVEDKIEGFQAGCDDYLAKPFSMEELVMRIKAVLRRTQEGAQHSAVPAAEELFALGTLQFDYPKRILKTPAEELTLTTREADLLKLLAQNLGSIVRRDLALKLIWGDDSYFNARSMDVFISKLRKYLAADPAIKLMNVHGTGYKLLIG